MIGSPQTYLSNYQRMFTWVSNYAGMQLMQWDFQNKGKLVWTGKSSFILKVLLRYLHLRIIYSVLCDQIV